jgi:hypothetical protein
MQHMVAQRSMVAGTVEAGGYLVGEVASPAVDALTPYMTTVRLGVATYDGLRGNLLVPRVTTSGTASWPGETGTAAESDPVLAQIECAPKKVIGYTQMSKQLLVQAPMIADRMVSANLLGVMGRELDKAVLLGTGTDQPLGILNTVGVTLTLGTGFTHANGQATIKNAAAANVIDANIMALGAPTVRETLSLRGLNGTAAEAGYVWQGGRFCSSVPAFVSSNVSAGQLFVGDFTQSWLMLWGEGVRLEIDPYSHFQSAIVGMRVVAYADVAVTQPAAYHVGTGIT